MLMLSCQILSLFQNEVLSKFSKHVLAMDHSISEIYLSGFVKRMVERNLVLTVAFAVGGGQ